MSRACSGSSATSRTISVLGGSSVATLLLAPAQQEGADQGGEALAPLVAAVRLDGGAEVAVEVLSGAEKARHQEVELRPELAEVVLERGAGQAEAPLDRQRLQRLGDLGGGVLDRLRLVEGSRSRTRARRAASRRGWPARSW